MKIEDIERIEVCSSESRIDQCAFLTSIIGCLRWKQAFALNKNLHLPFGGGFGLETAAQISRRTPLSMRSIISTTKWRTEATWLISLPPEFPPPEFHTVMKPRLQRYSSASETPNR